MQPKIVHVVGTGTIGGPLIALLCRWRERLGIDEVSFYKHTPRLADRPRLAQWASLGAKLAVAPEMRSAFRELGVEAAYSASDALGRATVVVDCAPKGVGQANRQAYDAAHQARGFIAQGGESDFGTLYAYGINDAALDPDRDRFLQVASCNTHSIASLLAALGRSADGGMAVEDARFVLMRRDNDVAQPSGHVTAPRIGRHDSERFGTHHAKDVHTLFASLGEDLDLYSSACVVNTPLMHAVHFSIRTAYEPRLEDIHARLQRAPLVACTAARETNAVFAFGREWGLQGRLVSQSVVSMPSLALRGRNEIVGFAFTPQDGNVLLSNIAAVLWYLHRDDRGRRMRAVEAQILKEV